MPPPVASLSSVSAPGSAAPRRRHESNRWTRRAGGGRGRVRSIGRWRCGGWRRRTAAAAEGAQGAGG